MNQISDRVRQQVIDWPSTAEHGAITAFCRTHGVSRAWFHSIRKRVATNPDTVTIKASTRPHRSPRATSAIVTSAVLGTRATLLAEGKDYGPLSIRDALNRTGPEPVPSRATIARILDRAHLPVRNKKKRPKTSYKRFAAELSNQRWQADGVGITLGTGKAVTIIHIIDDATRYVLGLHPDHEETSAAVVEAFARAIDVYGRPVLVHTDNGTAFNRERYGRTTQLMRFLHDLGVKMITGKPGHPRSQGKIERAHQSLITFVDAHAPNTRSELDDVLLAYAQWYNHERCHQALPPHTTPGQMYASLAKVAPPGDPISPHAKTIRIHEDRRAATDAVNTRQAGTRGGFRVWGKRFMLGRDWAGHIVHIVSHVDHLEIFDSEGTFLTSTVWPPTQFSTGLNRYIDTGPPDSEVSTMS